MDKKSIFVSIFSLFLFLSIHALGVELPKIFVFEYGEGHHDTAAFHIELSESGELVTTMYSAPYPINKTPTQTTVRARLTKKERETLLQLAIDADDFAQTGGGFHGDNASMIFDYDGMKIRKECFGADKWPPGPKTKSFLVELKRHLPEKMRSEF